MQEGNGTYYYVDGRIYKGGWTEGIQTGKGSMTFPDGDSYVGDWDSGNMNGWGAFYWNNGNSYQVRQGRGGKEVMAEVNSTGESEGRRDGGAGPALQVGGRLQVCL